MSRRYKQLRRRRHKVNQFFREAELHMARMQDVKVEIITDKDTGLRFKQTTWTEDGEPRIHLENIDHWLIVRTAADGPMIATLPGLTP